MDHCRHFKPEGEPVATRRKVPGKAWPLLDMFWDKRNRVAVAIMAFREYDEPGKPVYALGVEYSEDQFADKLVEVLKAAPQDLRKAILDRVQAEPF